MPVRLTPSIVRPWTAPERDHGRAVGVSAGDLDRVLHRLGPGGQEDALVGFALADQAVQLFGKFQIRPIGRDLKGHVGNAFKLLLHRCHDARMVVADVEYADACDEVEILLAFHIPNQCALGAGDGDRMGGEDAARDVGVTQCGELGGGTVSG
jgi:hypothetical protein